VHFAGITPSKDERGYWETNLGGTLRLAEEVRSLGCKKLVYISSKCAVKGGGSYGESKLAAENGLKKFPWDSLTILRPSEIYGAGGKEGVDNFIRMAKEYKLSPMLFGDSRIIFSPLHQSDFVEGAAYLILNHGEGIRSFAFEGPESFNGVDLALRLCKKYRALPIPLWLPLLSLSAKIFRRMNFPILFPDQINRLISDKNDPTSMNFNFSKEIKYFPEG